MSIRVSVLGTLLRPRHSLLILGTLLRDVVKASALLVDIAIEPVHVLATTTQIDEQQLYKN